MTQASASARAHSPRVKLGLRRVIRREEQPTASEAADATVNLPFRGVDGFMALNCMRGVK